MKPKIYITRPLPTAVIDVATEHFDVTVRQETSPMTLEALRDVLANFDGVLPTLRDPLSAATFPNTAQCKILANFGVGYDHIDVLAAENAGMVVSNTPSAVTDATADIALTLILMTARRAGEGERQVRARKWSGWHPTQFLGMHLGGKTLGVIGMGRIGKAIAHRCHYGFGMDVVFYNRSVVDDVPYAKQLSSVAEVMGADVVSLSLPRTPQTHHAIGVAEFDAMKPSGIFVNTARGDIVDEAALVVALQAGKLAGAGLDVYEREPTVSKELLGMENVTLLPHLGTAALDVRTNMGLMAVDNLVAFFEGKSVPNKVTAP